MMLNFACGDRIHNSWENIDFSPYNKYIKKVNLLGKLPYKDNSFDVAYSSHFLEHLSYSNAHKILDEINRILKPNGILRIVVPDLENICKAYISLLENITESNKNIIGGGWNLIKNTYKIKSFLIKNMIGSSLSFLIK